MFLFVSPEIGSWEIELRAMKIIRAPCLMSNFVNESTGMAIDQWNFLLN